MGKLFFDAINTVLNYSFDIINSNEKLKKLKEEIDERLEYEFLDEEYNNETDLMAIKYDTILVEEVKDKILELGATDYNKFCDLISLLALEYYNIIFYNALMDKNFENLEPDNNVIKDMINQPKQNFINDIYIGLNDNLVTILTTFFDEYNYDKILNEYNYKYILFHMEGFLTQLLYKKYHPNYKEEKREATLYDLNDKLDTVKINNILEFVYLSLLCKEKVEDSCDFAQVLQEKMWIIAEENEKFYYELILYLTKYFYIFYKNKKFDRNLIPIEKDIVRLVESGNVKDLLELEPSYELLKVFYNFNLSEYIEMNKKIDSDVKEKIKRLKIKY